MLQEIYDLLLSDKKFADLYNIEKKKDESWPSDGDIISISRKQPSDEQKYTYNPDVFIEYNKTKIPYFYIESILNCTVFKKFAIIVGNKDVYGEFRRNYGIKSYSQTVSMYIDIEEIKKYISQTEYEITHNVRQAIPENAWGHCPGCQCKNRNNFDRVFR